MLEVKIMEALPPVAEVLSVGSPKGKFKAGEPYQVTSAISLATADELRLAGSDYPAWVIKRYTQLPADLPQPVRDLALDLTAGIQTPYDKPKRLERYLKVNFPYNLKVSPRSTMPTGLAISYLPLSRAIASISSPQRWPSYRDQSAFRHAWPWVTPLETKSMTKAFTP